MSDTSAVSPLTAGLHCTCPRCGKGKLFKGYLKVAPTCSACGLDLSAEDSADGPAVFLIFILGFGIAPLAVYMGLTTTISPILQAILWIITTTGAALLLLQPLKAYTVALQYKHRREGGQKL